jgi:hypothetical protein
MDNPQPVTSPYNLLHWPMWVAVGSIFLTLFALRVAQEGSSLDKLPAPDDTINYWLLIFVSSDLLLFAIPIFIGIFVISALLVAATKQTSNLQEREIKLWAVMLLIIANIVACASCVKSIFRGDGITLTHLETIEVGDHIYHLTLGNEIASGWDVFFTSFNVFECDASGVQCRFLQEVASDLTGYISEEGHFVLDSNNQALYVEINDPELEENRILITQ